MPEADPLRELLAQCIERLETEGESVVESACARHPGLAADLRAALAQLRESGLVQASNDDPTDQQE